MQCVDMVRIVTICHEVLKHTITVWQRGQSEGVM
jgi:hypothetical protein